MIQDYGIEYTFHTDESGNEIQEVGIELTDNGFSPGLYPSESFDVSTGDNRFYCYVKVVDDLSVVDESTVRKEVDAYEPLIYPSEVFESSGMACCGQ